VTLPESTICDQTRAEFRNGMLELTVPKRQPSQPEAKKIPVTSATSNGHTAAMPQGQGATTQGQTTATSGQSAKDRQLQGANRK
jgi:hypothetical protein